MSAGLLQVPLVTLLALSPASAGLFFGGEQTGAYQHCLRSIVHTCCVRVMTERRLLKRMAPRVCPPVRRPAADAKVKRRPADAFEGAFFRAPPTGIEIL